MAILVPLAVQWPMDTPTTSAACSVTFFFFGSNFLFTRVCGEDRWRVVLQSLLL